MRRPHTTVNHTSPKTSPFPACSLMSSLPTAQDYSFDKVEEEYLSLREIILPAGARWAHLSQEEDLFESMGLCAVPIAAPNWVKAEEFKSSGQTGVYFTLTAQHLK